MNSIISDDQRDAIKASKDRENTTKNELDFVEPTSSKLDQDIVEDSQDFDVKHIEAAL